MKKVILSSLIILVMLLSNKTNVSAQVFVRFRLIPPIALLLRPPLAGPLHVWIDGEWRWDIGLHKYVWVNGFWAVPPVGRVWAPGYWLTERGGRRWVPGHWRRR